MPTMAAHSRIDVYMAMVPTYMIRHVAALKIAAPPVAHFRTKMCVVKRDMNGIGSFRTCLYDRGCNTELLGMS